MSLHPVHSRSVRNGIDNTYAVYVVFRDYVKEMYKIVTRIDKTSGHRAHLLVGDIFVFMNTHLNELGIKNPADITDIDTPMFLLPLAGEDTNNNVGTFFFKVDLGQQNVKIESGQYVTLGPNIKCVPGYLETHVEGNDHFASWSAWKRRRPQQDRQQEAGGNRENVHNENYDSDPEPDSPRPQAANRDPLSYYSILEVATTATQAEIKKAYRKMAMQWHPDKCADRNPESDLYQQYEATFKKVGEAYEVLYDDEKRRNYDRGAR